MMKILIVSTSEKSLNIYENLLNSQKIRVIKTLYSGIGPVLDQLKDDDSGEIKAVLLDRILFSRDEMRQISMFVDRLDTFWVIEDWSKMEDLEMNEEEYCYRFYNWPVNYNLIIDDIKSICLYKNDNPEGTIPAGGLEIDLNTHEITDGKTRVMLKNKEFELMVYMARNKGKVLTRTNILENVWDMNAQIITNTVDVHISKVRRLMKDKFGVTNYIKTIPCYGYQLI